ncbi:MAG: sugar ABC transporter permease [Firmicutes bacterium]|jgi:multiple sugar transport system permease protein|nr:sugar ABC transporter permease [Bacillota bacterium]
MGAPVTAGGKTRRGKGLSESQLGRVLVTPAVIVMCAVVFFPILATVWLSLHKYNLKYPYLGQPFVGLDNYVKILSDGRFLNSLKVTTLFTVSSVSVELVLGMAIALLLNRPFKGRGLVRTAVLVPWALTTVVMARMWAWIFNSEYGVFNAILYGLGFIDQYIPWVADTQFALWAAMGADIWKTTPFMALLLSAGLQTIPRELYEASMVDGASGWKQFWSITIPILKPTILVALLFRTLDAARVFDLLFVLTGGGPGFATESLSIYTYRSLFVNLDFGYGSALAVATFLYVMLISFIYIKVLGARTER